MDKKYTFETKLVLHKDLAVLMKLLPDSNPHIFARIGVVQGLAGNLHFVNGLIKIAVRVYKMQSLAGRQQALSKLCLCRYNNERLRRPILPWAYKSPPYIYSIHLLVNLGIMAFSFICLFKC